MINGIEKNLPILSVVLNWNGEKVLKLTLDTLSRQTATPHHILVIDNASTDDSEKIVFQYPNATLFQLKKNVGFAKGNNAILTLNVQLPIDWKNGWLFFSNNDVEYSSTLLEELRTIAETTSSFATLTPWIAFGDRKDLLWYGGAKVIPFIGYVGHRYLGKNYKKIEDCRTEISDYGTGCSLFLSAQDFFEVGGFDDGYPHYCEDLDLCYRLKKKFNKNSIVYRKVLAYHYVSSSMKGNPKKYFWRTAALTRFFWKLNGKLLPIPLFCLLLISLLSGWYRCGTKGIMQAYKGWKLGMKLKTNPIPWESIKTL
ncbi:MAG: glycosyltransferase family 2 protein [bacterium]|nr:glycosyltransferase family 2 protein [bacterium]